MNGENEIKHSLFFITFSELSLSFVFIGESLVERNFNVSRSPSTERL